MPHAAIIGQTTSGKTFLGQQLAKGFQAAGVGVLVLHKPREPWPYANWQTSDPERFLAKFWQCQRCAVFMELADNGVSKWDERFHKCFTEGRHNGHRCFYLSQRAATVHPAIRENCESLYLFTVSAKAATVWSEEFCDTILLKASSIDQYHFLYKRNRYTPATESVLVIKRLSQ